MLVFFLGRPALGATVARALAPHDFAVERVNAVEAVVAALDRAGRLLVVVDWDGVADAAGACRALAEAAAAERATVLALSDTREPARMAAILAAGAVDVLRLPEDTARLAARALAAAAGAGGAPAYQGLFVHNPLPMWIVDEESDAILAVSDGVVQTYGWPRAELLRMTARDLRAPTDPGPDRGPRCDAVRADVVRHRRRDGSEFLAQVTWQPLLVAGRRAAFVVARDVTETTRESDSFRRALSEYRSFVERSADGVFTHRVDGTVAYANAAFVAFLGYDRADELVDRPVLDVVHPEDREVVQARIDDIVGCDRPSAPRAIRFLARDGSIRWAETRGLSVRFGDAPAVTVIARDLTERHKADEALRRSEERFATFFRASPAGTAIVRVSDGKFVDVNERFSFLTGYTREEVLGHTGAELGLWQDTDQRGRMYGAIAGSGSVRELEVHLVHKSGKPIDLLMSIDRVDVGGEACFLTSGRDMTEYKRVVEQLHHARKMEAIGRLAGGIAHDFNNVLTGIGGYSEILVAQLPDGSPARQAAEHIRRATQRAAGLTGQLLVFTRRQATPTRVVALNELVQPIGELLRPIVGGDITLELRLGADVGLVRVDPGQIDQVILNLVINARDAMPSGGQLTVETARDVDAAGKRWARLRVRDTGCGMSDEVRTRVFEPFFTTKPVGKGTGLGLSIVYGIVEQSGGTVSVNSAPGRGTTIEMALPEAEAPPESASLPSATAAGAKAARGRESILMVEDDEDVRDFVSFVLAQAGYEVLVAEDGASALALAERHLGAIQLLLSDIVMPAMNGRQLALELLRRRPALRVLHMSGYPGDAGLPRDEAYEGADFVQKPFSAEELLRRVRASLDQPPR